MRPGRHQKWLPSWPLSWILSRIRNQINPLELIILLCLRAPVRKNQTYRDKGGKFDFFHILMLDRLGYN